MNTKSILGGLTLAGFYLAAAAIIKWASHVQAIGPGGESQAIQVVIGLGLALYANFIPKRVAGSGRMRSALRVAGWSFTLAGLGYAGAAFAPPGLAYGLSVGIVLSAMVVTLLYGAWACVGGPRDRGIHPA